MYMTAIVQRKKSLVYSIRTCEERPSDGASSENQTIKIKLTKKERNFINGAFADFSWAQELLESRFLENEAISPENE